MIFDISDYVTIIEPMENRSDYLDEQYRPGIVAYALAVSDVPICIIDCNTVYPAVIALLKDWFVDGVITNDEMDDVVLLHDSNPRLTREYIVEKINDDSLEAWTMEWVRKHSGLDESASDDDCIDAYHQRRLGEYKTQIHDGLQGRFNQMYRMVGDALWSLFDKSTDKITSKVERNIKYNMLILMETLVNRAVTSKYGGIATKFYLTGDKHERNNSVWRVSPRKHL